MCVVGGLGVCGVCVLLGEVCGVCCFPVLAAVCTYVFVLHQAACCLGLLIRLVGLVPEGTGEGGGTTVVNAPTHHTGYQHTHDTTHTSHQLTHTHNTILNPSPLHQASKEGSKQGSKEGSKQRSKEGSKQGSKEARKQA